MGLPQTSQLHFVLFPFLAQGHMIPMVDIGKIMARRGAIVTIVTTPVNAARFKSVLGRAKESGLPIRMVELRFPCAEAGLPEGCENLDMLNNLGDKDAVNFLSACSMLEDQAENLFKELSPRPSCIISDMCFPYTLRIANKFKVPRITFLGFSSFALFCLHCSYVNQEFVGSIKSETEYFVLPGWPDEIEFTKAQLPVQLNDKGKEFLEQIVTADLASLGVVVNSFEELEPAYVEAYKQARGNVWCVGPVSLSNEDNLDRAQRGNSASTNEQLHHSLMKWLDSQVPSSVVYACFGSLCNLLLVHLVELALGLEASGKPFIWAVRGNDNLKEVDKWIAENQFEDRIKGRGFLIRGWAPQLLILSHPAVGGFLTHCGWNSTLEGISVGVPLITWPLFADQFCNEKLVVQVLKIGVSVGAGCPMKLGEEAETGVLVQWENVKNAVDMLMDESEEANAIRERATKLGMSAKRSVQGEGSSYHNLTMLIEQIKQDVERNNAWTD